MEHQQSERSWTAEESEAAFEELGDRLIDVTRRFIRSSARLRLQNAVYEVDGHTLGVTQVDALEALVAGPLRMNELAAHVRIDASTATRATAPLVDLGLAERTTDETNRRYVVLSITERGRQVAATLAKRRGDLMRSVLEPMAPRRRLLLAELLAEYLDLQDAAAGSEP